MERGTQDLGAQARHRQDRAVPCPPTVPSPGTRRWHCVSVLEAGVHAQPLQAPWWAVPPGGAHGESQAVCPAAQATRLPPPPVAMLSFPSLPGGHAPRMCFMFRATQLLVCRAGLVALGRCCLGSARLSLGALLHLWPRGPQRLTDGVLHCTRGCQQDNRTFQNCVMMASAYLSFVFPHVWWPDNYCWLGRNR